MYRLGSLLLIKSYLQMRCRQMHIVVLILIQALQGLVAFYHEFCFSLMQAGICVRCSYLVPHPRGFKLKLNRLSCRGRGYVTYWLAYKIISTSARISDSQYDLSPVPPNIMYDFVEYVK